MAMTNRDNQKFNHIILKTMEDLVPLNHKVRMLESAIDWRFIYPLVEPLYSKNGRPSIDPVVLFKILVINYTFGYNSIRKTCNEIEVNFAYRWFLGYDIDEKVPNYSTWSQNYIRRYGNSEVFEQIFEKILGQAIDYGFVETDTVFVDGTHMKASANKRKHSSKEIKIAKKAYEDELLEEINEVRNQHNQKPVKNLHHVEYDFDEETGEQIEVIADKKEIKVSTTDPDAGDYHKGEHERCFAYCHQTFCDTNGFVLAFETVSGNTHDSVSFHPAYNKLLEKFSNIQNVVLDAGFKTPAIAREILMHNQKPYFPYKRPLTKKGFFKKYDYVYDEQYDCYICPNGKILKYTTTNKQGYKEYKSKPCECSTCPFREKCTNSKNNQKVVTRHVWAEYMEKAEDIRHTPEWKEIYGQRKETIERVFAEDKENHCLRFTRVRGLKKNRHATSMIFACHNLEKMARWRWKSISSDLEFMQIIVKTEKYSHTYRNLEH